MMMSYKLSQDLKTKNSLDIFLLFYNNITKPVYHTFLTPNNINE